VGGEGGALCTSGPENPIRPLRPYSLLPLCFPALPLPRALTHGEKKKGRENRARLNVSKFETQRRQEKGEVRRKGERKRERERERESTIAGGGRHSCRI